MIKTNACYIALDDGNVLDRAHRLQIDRHDLRLPVVFTGLMRSHN